MQPDTYYSRTLDDHEDRPALDSHIETDVVVIGGGLAGLATALGLLERGKKVVVLEGRCLGYGASGRNGGFCMAGYALGNEDLRALVHKVGRDHAKALYGLTTAAQALIKRRIEKFDIPCMPVNGQVIAWWQDDPHEIKSIIAYMNEHFGTAYEFWPREKMRDLYRTDKYYDALYMPGNFHIHPLRYIHGLAGAIESAGGKIFESSEALRLESKNDTHTVFTQQGSVKAAQVVFCGSAYFNGLERKLSSSCLPVSTYVMVTEPLAEDVMHSAIRAPHAIHDTRFAYDYYRPLPDGRLLWGGRVAYNQTPANLGAVMQGDMLKIYPQLEGVKMETAWSGLMGYTTHKMPHIGQLRPGVWACTNFGGNGVGPTTAGGEIIAAAIAEQDKTYKLFAPFFDFKWVGGALGPVIARNVYRSWEVRDKIYEWRAACKHKRVS